MRTLSILIISFFAAGCDPGKAGEECAGVDTCQEGLRCVEGVCKECGGSEEVCCALPGGPEVCDEPGVACSGGTWDYGVCVGDCGQIDLPCCGNECFNGTCYLGKCIDDGGGDECHDPGGQPHQLFIIDAGCNQHLVNFQTKTPEQAEACRQALITNDADYCELDTAPQSKHFCGFSNVPPANSVTFDYCSDASLEHCKEVACGSETCNWVEMADPCQ